MGSFATQLVLQLVLTIFAWWWVSQPALEKRCNESELFSRQKDGIAYSVYAHTYTLDKNVECLSADRSKAIEGALETLIDDVHSHGSAAICRELDHGSPWKGVTVVSRAKEKINPQEVCQ